MGFLYSAFIENTPEAREDGLSEITLFEAIPDNGNPGYIYCTVIGEVGERSECRKAVCPDYESKSGRGVCKYRGKLCTHGDKVTFKID